MRSLVIHAPKDLRIEDHPEEPPGPGGVKLRIEVGGICGSDLHYYNHGGFGAIRLQEPMILGHEVAGRIVELGPETDGLSEGDLVAVNPSRPCGACFYCHDGLPNHCLDMRFYGSAMRMPHVQGAFSEVLVAEARQCVTVPESLSPAEAAMGEPLSVALHAVRRAGDLLGKRVLVTGCGPIGVLVVLAARRAGAREIVAADIAEQPLAHAAAAGADHIVNSASDPEGLAAYKDRKGLIDVLFEASGAAPALVGALEVVRPRGLLVQVGLGGEATLPINAIVAKELELRGTFRFHEEFAWAVQMMGQGLIDTRPLITHSFPVERAVEAFEVASDRSRAMKAQIAFR